MECLKDINIKIKLTNDARKNMIDTGYDVNFGARPLKRLVSRIIETNLSKMIISDKIKYGSEVIIDYKNEDYVFEI